VILAFCAVAAVADPGFLSMQSLTDLLRGGIKLGIFAVGVMVVLVSGGIDVSFTALAAFAMYTTTLMLVAWAAGPALAGGVSGRDGDRGGARGDQWAVHRGLRTADADRDARDAVDLPWLRADLRRLEADLDLPAGMRDFSRLMLVRATSADGSFYSLPGRSPFLVGVVVVTWAILHRTMLGRAIFAIGGSMESARRIGIPVRATQFFVCVYVSALAGLAGIIHASMARVANPFYPVGLELSVIAAVAGGYGTLGGTLLGVALIVLVRNSLIVLGIPSTWQSVAIGVIILIGTGVPAWRAKRAAARAA
jgi:simple sugar transport system permease protein